MQSQTITLASAPQTVSHTVYRLQNTAAAAAGPAVEIARESLPSLETSRLSPEQTHNLKHRIKALSALLDINDRINLDQTCDDLSIAIFEWIDDVIVLSRKILLNEHEESFSESLDQLEMKIEELAKKILVNPLDFKLLDNPSLEAGTFIWGDHYLTQLKANSTLSPYTQKPFETTPHALARDILDWGKTFFPGQFEQAPSLPLCSVSLRLLKLNAKGVAHAKAVERQMLKFQEENSALAKKNAKSAIEHLTNLHNRNIKVESDIRAQGQEECDRLRNRILSMQAEFKQAIAKLEADIESERKASSELRISNYGLRIRLDRLEENMRQANLEIGYLRSGIAAANNRINDSGDDCQIM